MATSSKLLTPKDQVSTRTLLHEAVPVTGQIISGTYGVDATPINDAPNIKNYAHGMFQSVYDYPYLSSSANHILDLTMGYSANSVLSKSTATTTQQSKKINIYNEMAQVLVGFNESGSVREFDEDGDLTSGTKIQEAYFFNFTRLLTKDEIKKGSFTLELGTNAMFDTPFVAGSNFSGSIKLTDYSGSNGYKVNSPAGEYGILYATSSQTGVGSGEKNPLLTSKIDENGYVPAGLIYYQAGIAVVTASVFSTLLASPPSASFAGEASGSLTGSFSGSSISGNCSFLRHRIESVSFNNTTELNSTVYFCRANHNEFNCSSNQTYVSGSKFVVKTNANDMSVAYPTTVGLYSADNELMAVAKLSEPLKKDPTTEFTLRVRLDY
tara:strand:+ start:23316 stop:24458 length:1143 start_codon:yes stop_codon:yes gene_type:complete